MGLKLKLKLKALLKEHYDGSKTNSYFDMLFGVLTKFGSKIEYDFKTQTLNINGNAEVEFNINHGFEYQSIFFYLFFVDFIIKNTKDLDSAIGEHGNHEGLN